MPSIVVVFAAVFVALIAFAQPAAETRAASGGELEIRAVDHDTGMPVPVRMHLKDARGRPVKPPGLVYWHDHFAVPGTAVLELRAGTYTFEMERGPEYRIRTGRFTIKRGDADNKQVEMERFVDMKKEGWWSGDLHIHRRVKDIEVLMLAEDLHVGPVITWWNEKNEWKGRIAPDPLFVSFDKDRFYHVMAGEDEREGGALMYFNLRQPLPIAGADREHPSPCDFLILARKQNGVHVDIEKPFWWDMPIWIASKMIDSIGLSNGHMQRDGMLANEAWGKPRDKREYPDPHGNGFWSQDIYYRLLECGIRIPPSAGSASGVLANPVGYNRVYVHCGRVLEYDQWWENLRAGRVVVTNGPLIRDPRVNDELPGHVFRAEDEETLELHAALNLSIRERVDYLEIVKDGQVAHEVRLDDWAKAGGRLPPVEFKQSGWMLIRAVTSNPNTYRFASTGPYYVEIGGQRRISKEAAQFFLDWVHERARRVTIEDPEKREAVIKYHRGARDYWQKIVDMANAD
ncbi:MAG: CehA/McbA family metallohydrolase [Planctomycetes bacterium]|nr:CehA/McbA family metallohydrolase [Planctomycetota bacterium]